MLQNYLDASPSTTLHVGDQVFRLGSLQKLTIWESSFQLGMTMPPEEPVVPCGLWILKKPDKPWNSC